MQVIEVFLITAGFAGALCDGVGEAEGAGAATSWVSFTFTVGLEKVKPYAAKRNQPSFSLTIVVATLFSPDSLITETLA